MFSDIQTDLLQMINHPRGLEEKKAFFALYFSSDSPLSTSMGSGLIKSVFPSSSEPLQRNNNKVDA